MRGDPSTGTPTPRPRPRRSSWRQTRAALVVSAVARLVIGTLALLLLVSLVPTVAGWEATVVLSDSMRPSVAAGDVVVVRPVDAADLSLGSVLLVDSPDVPGSLRLHRLVEVSGGDLRLQGDANSSPDGSLVDAAAVHGVGTVRLPLLGLPALWAAQDRTGPLAASAAGLLLLLALAVAHRPAAPAPGSPLLVAGSRAGGTGLRPAGRRAGRTAVGAAGVTGTAMLLAVLLGALPGLSAAGAVFTARTANDANAWAAIRYFTCASAAAGESAAQYMALQETAGPTAANDGSFTRDATYSSTGVTYRVSGPLCRSATRAVRLDGAAGYVWTSISVTAPGTFSTQLWFNTSTTRGGYLFGFGNGTSGAQSSSKDRLVYMLNSGQLRFGVYDGAVKTVTSPGTYNDGDWHLMTATLSPGTGLRLFVDGALVASNGAYTRAESTTGSFRMGWDSLAGWPDRPTSDYFTGSIAHAGVFVTALTAGEVADQYAPVG